MIAERYSNHVCCISNQNHSIPSSLYRSEYSTGVYRVAVRAAAITIKPGIAIKGCSLCPSECTKTQCGGTEVLLCNRWTIGPYPKFQNSSRGYRWGAEMFLALVSRNVTSRGRVRRTFPKQNFARNRMASTSGRCGHWGPRYGHFCDDSFLLRPGGGKGRKAVSAGRQCSPRRPVSTCFRVWGPRPMGGQLWPLFSADV